MPNNLLGRAERESSRFLVFLRVVSNSLLMQVCGCMVLGNPVHEEPRML